MIWNVIDNRRRKYRWAKVNAVIEDVSHDNSCADADQAATDDEAGIAYDTRRDISVHEAIVWAEAELGKVTLYLYDQGDGI